MFVAILLCLATPPQAPPLLEQAPPLLSHDCDPPPGLLPAPVYVPQVIYYPAPQRVYRPAPLTLSPYPVSFLPVANQPRPLVYGSAPAFCAPGRG
jgi:hypothetical protein